MIKEYITKKILKREIKRKKMYKRGEIEKRNIKEEIQRENI